MLDGAHLQRRHSSMESVNGVLNLGLVWIGLSQCARKILIGCPHFCLIGGPILGKAAFQLGDLVFLNSRQIQITMQDGIEVILYAGAMQAVFNTRPAGQAARKGGHYRDERRDKPAERKE